MSQPARGDSLHTTAGVEASLRSTDWDFVSSDKSESIHTIHPYPAKFIPEIPRTLIRTLGVAEGTAVFDPFCGSGATLVEAQAAGYPVIGNDLNPIAVLISKVKTSTPPTELGQVANDVSGRARRAEAPVLPGIPNVDHWFEADIQASIASLVHEIDAVAEEQARMFMRAALSSILVRVSNQESDTRYAAVQKGHSGEDVFQFFDAAVAKIIRAHEKYQRDNGSVEVLSKDVLDLQPSDVSKPIGLVVTSPPYPNAYEYWLYHKYRMYWLGFDPQEVKRREIGARAHYFKSNPPTEKDFHGQLLHTTKLFNAVMVPGAFACVIIGRSKVHGRIIDNAKLVEEAARDAGLVCVTRIERKIFSSRKSFNLSHAKIRREDIVVLRKP